MAQTCSVAVHRTQPGYLVRVTGRGTLRDSPLVRDFVTGVMDDGADVVLDMSSCEHLDSTFLGCLVILHQYADHAPGSFTVYADEKARQRLLHNVRLDRFFRFADCPPPCIGRPVCLPATQLPTSEFGRHVMETHHKLAELGGPAADTFRGIAEQLAKELNSPLPPTSGHRA